MSISARWSVWAETHPLLPVLLIVALLCGVLVAIAYVPLGSPTMVEARVLHIGTAHSKYGNRLNATVQLGDRTVPIGAYILNGCAVGDKILLRREQHVWGVGFSAGAAPCKVSSRGDLPTP